MGTNVRIKLSTVDDVKEFVNITLDSKIQADVISGRHIVDGRSIMGLFSLDLVKPLELRIISDISNTEEYLIKIDKFIV